MLRRLAREYALVVAVLCYAILLAVVMAPRRILQQLPWSALQVAAGVVFAILVGVSAALVVVAA